LYKRIDFFHPIMGIQWNDAQYQMYRALYRKERQILVKMSRREGATFGLAGIAASFAYRRRRVCVITNSLRTNNNFVALLDKMGKSPISIDMYCSYSCADYDGSYDLTLIDYVDNIPFGHLANVYKMVSEKNLLLLCTTSTGPAPHFDLFTLVVEIKK